jgi:hypothetical protein
MAIAAPSTLAARGKKLWREIVKDHEIDAVQRVTLEEACRCADRLEELDEIIRGKGVGQLMRFRLNLGEELDNPESKITITIDGVLAEARQQQNVFKQLLVALRLPDADSGQKPQRRGARGAYTPSAEKSGGKVTSLMDRFG